MKEQDEKFPHKFEDSLNGKEEFTHYNLDKTELIGTEVTNEENHSRDNFIEAIVGELRKLAEKIEADKKFKKFYRPVIDALNNEIDSVAETASDLYELQIKRTSGIDEEQTDLLKDCAELNKKLEKCCAELRETKSDLEFVRRDIKSARAKIAKLTRQTKIKDLLEDGLLQFLTDVHRKTEEATDLQKLKTDISDLEQIFIDDLRFKKIEIISHKNNDHISESDLEFVDAKETVFTDKEELIHCIHTAYCYGAIIRESNEEKPEVIKEKIIIYVKNKES